MNSILWTVFLFVICFYEYHCYNSTDNQNDILLFTTVLYRHGDRTPVKPYPNDPHKDESLWPIPYGSLSNLGIQQMYELGQYLRKRYGHILSDVYSKNDIKIVSTDHGRALESAQATLAGLYPPTNSQIWNKHIFWRPIAVHSIPKPNDNLFGTNVPKCSAYQKALTNLMNSPQFIELDRQLEPLYAYVTNHTGEETYSIGQFKNLYDTLTIQKRYNKTLPAWTDSIMPELEKHARLAFRLSSYTSELAKFRCGFLLKDIFDRLYAMSTTKSQNVRFMQMYSAHDSTIVSVLHSLGLYDDTPPSYAACLMFELWKSANGTGSVKLFYKKSTDSSAEPLEIPNCGQECPILKMYELYSHVLPVKEYEEECKGEES